MFKKILNFFFGKKENTQTTTSSIHNEIAKFLKEREEILSSLKAGKDSKVIFSETASIEKPKKPKAPRKPKSEFPIGTDKPTKVKPVTKVKAPKTSTEETPKRTRKPKTDK
jgi:hypothetical protein